MLETFSIEVEGADEVVAMLRSVSREAVAGGFIKGLEAGAAVIERELLARTPEGDPASRHEGETPLKDSIVTEIYFNPRYGTMNADVGFGNEGYKARFVEYGHRMVGHKPDKKELSHVEVKPFMRPAAAAAFEPAVHAFGTALFEEVKKVAGEAFSVGGAA
ncbi:MAG: HK97 gp10 family phage protein [Acidobacteriota bacterium]